MTKSCEAVGRRLGISKETLRGWCRQAQVDAGEREGVTSEELAEIKRLKAENRRLREDVEILRAATTSRGSSTPERRSGGPLPRSIRLRQGAPPGSAVVVVGSGERYLASDLAHIWRDDRLDQLPPL